MTKNSAMPIKIQMGSVSSQAISMLRTVFFCRLSKPLWATMVPAMPELKMCVVLTGRLSADDALMVAAAMV